MFLTDLQQLLGIAASAAVTFGVIVALLQLRNQHRLRLIDMVMRLYSSFGQEAFIRHFHRVLNWKYRTYEDYKKHKSEDDHISLFVVGVFFENMGLLYKRGLAPLELIDDLLSGPILQSWEKTRPIWEGFRAEYNQPQWAEWFEFLYESMVKRLDKLKNRR